VDGLRRLREPAALSVLVALLLQVLITWVGSVRYGDVRYRMPETLTILVLGLIVASCVLGQRTAHARTLTVLALVGSMLSILSSVTLQVIAPVNGSLVVWLDLVLDLVVPVLVVVGLTTLLAGQRAAAATAPQSPAIAQSAPATPIAQSAPATPAALSSSQLEPVWQPDEASGAAWYTAGDAALGAPAAGWGTPGESGGWQAIGDEDDPSRADRSGPES
jgi:hypothetical protein